MKPATVISKRRGDEVEMHYLVGPQRATREEAEADLARFTASAYADGQPTSATAGTPEEANAELARRRLEPKP